MPVERPQTTKNERRRPSVGERVWYAWGLAVAGFFTLVLGVFFFIHHALQDAPDVWTFWSRTWARSIAVGIGLRVDAEYHPALDPAAAYVYASNHQSAIDILVHLMTMPGPFGFLAKAELARVPVLGATLARSHCVFVDRNTLHGARESLDQAARRVGEGLSVLIYPEGGRSHQVFLLPFRRGAFRLAEEAGVPVVPVAVLGSVDVCDMGRRRLWPGRVRVRYGRPIRPEDMSGNQTASFLAATREAMEELLDAPSDDGPNR